MPLEKYKLWRRGDCGLCGGSALQLFDSWPTCGGCVMAVHDLKSGEVFTASPEETELLCLLTADLAAERGGATPQTAEVFGASLFEGVWGIHKGADLGQMVTHIAKGIALLTRVPWPNAQLVSDVFALAVTMYNKEPRIRTAREAILYAGIMERHGRLKEDGTVAPVDQMKAGL